VSSLRDWPPQEPSLVCLLGYPPGDAERLSISFQVSYRSPASRDRSTAKPPVIAKINHTTTTAAIVERIQDAKDIVGAVMVVMVVVGTARLANRGVYANLQDL
jgi:hypothetical protein